MMWRCVAVTDVYPASEKPLPGVSGETILDEVKLRAGELKLNLQTLSTPTMMIARDKIGNLAEAGRCVHYPRCWQRS